MLKITFLTLAAAVVASSIWIPSASAADPNAPIISATPMAPSPTGGGFGGSQPSDLPAPNTTSWVNRPLLVTGAIVLVASYAPMAGIAYTSDRPADQKNLYYPVVGPWMNLADRQCDSRPCSNETLTRALLIADGVAQGIGALGVVSSFFLPNKTTRHWYLIGNDSVHISPTSVGIAGYGLGAAGTF